MSAYNWITAFATCPHCGTEHEIVIQTHMSSSYGGDERGRFFDRCYALGEKMRWWSKSHPKFAEWIVSHAVPKEPDSFLECCYGKCSGCKQEIDSVVQFSDVTPVLVKDIGVLDEWPSDFP